MLEPRIVAVSKSRKNPRILEVKIPLLLVKKAFKNILFSFGANIVVFNGICNKLKIKLSLFLHKRFQKDVKKLTAYL